MASECNEYIENITFGIPPYRLLFYINPVDTPIWEPRDKIWDCVFLSYSVVFATLNFLLGLLAVFLIIKRKCIRLKTKTFFAVYTCLAILGFSRALYLAIDPYGVIGWMIDYFPQWTIISRFLSILGFPSLTASYSLVFITIYKSTSIGSSRLWHQDWRVIIVICAIHYIIAITAEIIANTESFPALLSVVICDAAFSLWGIFICIIYLIAGCRLVQNLKKQCSKSVRMSSSFSASDKERKKRRKTRTQNSEDIFHDENYQRQYNRISNSLRKIAKITFFTAVLGIFYAIVNLAALVFTVWFIFVQCLGLNGLGNSIAWLTLQIGIKSIEIPSALVMIYSVTNVPTICGCFMKRSQTTFAQQSSSPPPQTISQNSTTSFPTETSNQFLPSTSNPPAPLRAVIVHSSTDESIPRSV